MNKHFVRAQSGFIIVRKSTFIADDPDNSETFYEVSSVYDATIFPMYDKERMIKEVSKFDEPDGWSFVKTKRTLTIETEEFLY